MINIQRLNFLINELFDHGDKLWYTIMNAFVSGKNAILDVIFEKFYFNASTDDMNRRHDSVVTQL